MPMLLIVDGPGGYELASSETTSNFTAVRVLEIYRIVTLRIARRCLRTTIKGHDPAREEKIAHKLIDLTRRRNLEG